jgi:hypothetical protein
MSYTYEQLSKMTVVELRKIADGVEHEATKGHLTMHKEKLLPALCLALGIETHVHHEAKGIDKGQLKLHIRSLKKERESALQAHDSAKLKDIRMQIKKLKKTLRKAIV